MNKSISLLTLNQANITNFARVRNQLMKKVNKPWVLFLDTDEKLTENLKKEINQAIKDANYNYQFKRTDYFLGKKLFYGETSRAKLTRLIQPGTGTWQGGVHEIFVSKLPIKTLKYPVLHQRQMSLSQFIDKINHYTTLRSQELSHFSYWQLFFYPPIKFIYNYLILLGFLDGWRGFIMAFMMSFHSLLVRLKTYES